MNTQNTKNEVIKLLEEHTSFLATKGTCGNPRVRPMRSALWHNNHLYMALAKDKNMYKHMSNFPGIEICCYDEVSTWVRIRGEARIVDHKDIKEAMFQKYPNLKELYVSPDNPNFAVFYIDNANVKIQDTKGRKEEFGL